MPGAESISLFHVLARGECRLGFEGSEMAHMGEGDVVVFPRAKRHFMGSAADASPVPITKIVTLPVSGAPVVRHGGGGDVTTFVCGYFQCDQRFNPLMETLPEMIHVRRSDCDAWLDAMLDRMVVEAESGRPGSLAMMSRLAELLFVEVMRRHMESMAHEETGWLAGLRDPYVGAALRLFHAQPQRDWTVEDLSHEVGVSRSLLADRFTALIGDSPMRYLASWRMQLAQYLLLEGDMSLCQVAERVGYESGAAFNRAFKRIVGNPPATWRRHRMVG
jgi:AraC-like DNA-binding protein